VCHHARVISNYSKFEHTEQRLKLLRQKLIELKTEIDKYAIVAGVFNIPLLVLDRTRRQKISKDIDDTNNTCQMEQADIYGTFHPTAAEQPFLSRAHGEFTTIDHTLGITSTSANLKE
jgi:hypothetical protein